MKTHTLLKMMREAVHPAEQTAYGLLAGAMLANPCRPETASMWLWRYKRGHSIRTARIAGHIAEAMGMEPRQALLLKVAAILHDAGRFEQVRHYCTYADSQSIDHGQASSAVVEAGRGPLMDSGLTKKEVDEIVVAVRIHNKLPGTLENNISGGVRDCDRIDIAANAPHIFASEKLQPVLWHTGTWSARRLAPDADALSVALAGGDITREQMNRNIDNAMSNVFSWTVGNLSTTGAIAVSAKRGLATRLLDIFDPSATGFAEMKRCAQGR